MKITRDLTYRIYNKEGEHFTISAETVEELKKLARQGCNNRGWEVEKCESRRITKTG